MRIGVVGLSVAAAILTAANTVAVRAQSYPERPITMIVPFAPGGATDVIARIVAEGMSKRLGQPIIIENVAGAGGTTGSRRAKDAAPDGYTLLVGHMGTHSSAFSLYARPPYDPRSDFDAIGLLASAPIVLFTSPSFPASNLKEFVARLKTEEATVGHSGVGSNAHLTCALLGSLTGTKARGVSYRGNGPLMTDILSGNIDYSCDQIITIASQISGGNVKGIAITGGARSPLLPDLPTFGEAGLPAFDADAWTALFASKGLAPNVIAKVHAAYFEALDEQTISKRLVDLGAVVPLSDKRSREHLSRLVAAEVVRWAKVIEDAGIVARQ